MKKSKNFLKLDEKPNGEVFLNKIAIKATRDNRISINKEEFDIKPNVQAHFTDTKLTTKSMHNKDNLTVFSNLTNVGFYDIIPKKSLKSARLRDTTRDLPKALAKMRYPLLTPFENIKNISDNLQ